MKTKMYWDSAFTGGAGVRQLDTYRMTEDLRELMENPVKF